MNRTGQNQSIYHVFAKIQWRWKKHENHLDLRKCDEKHTKLNAPDRYFIFLRIIEVVEIEYLIIVFW